MKTLIVFHKFYTSFEIFVNNWIYFSLKYLCSIDQSIIWFCYCILICVSHLMREAVTQIIVQAGFFLFHKTGHLKVEIDSQMNYKCNHFVLLDILYQAFETFFVCLFCTSIFESTFTAKRWYFHSLFLITWRRKSVYFLWSSIWIILDLFFFVCILIEFHAFFAIDWNFRHTKHK